MGIVQPKICYIVQWKLSTFFVCCAISDKAALTCIEEREREVLNMFKEYVKETIYTSEFNSVIRWEKSCIVSETILKIRINISFLSVSSVCASAVGWGWGRETCECVRIFFVWRQNSERLSRYFDQSSPKKKSFFLSSFPRYLARHSLDSPKKKSGEPNKKITHRKRESGKVRSRAHWWAGKESPQTRSRRRRFCLYFDLKTKVWDKIPNRARNILFESYLEALIGPSLCWLLVERRADKKLQKKNSREIFQKR